MGQIHATAAAGLGRTLACVALMALTWTLSACEGERGDSGAYYAYVEYTSDVLAADLSELGIAQGSDLPDPGERFLLTSRKGRVLWTSNSGGSEVQYLVTVSLKERKGKKGDSGLFPANDAVDIPPVTANTGADGSDLTLRFFIRRDELHVFQVAQPRQGIPLD